MSLCDEVMPRSSETVNFSRVKYDEQVEIDWQMEQFVAAGGSIKEIPNGVCAISESRPPLRNEYTGEVSVKEYDSRHNKQQRAVLSVQHQSAFGENIYQYENSKFFYVKLGGRYYGARMRLTNDGARELRDKLRNEFGMPPAEY